MNKQTLPCRQKRLPDRTPLRQHRKDLPTRVPRMALPKLHVMVKEQARLARALRHEARGRRGLVGQHGGAHGEEGLEGGGGEDAVGGRGGHAGGLD